MTRRHCCSGMLSAGAALAMPAALTASDQKQAVTA
jgi:hypothetical protein